MLPDSSIRPEPESRSPAQPATMPEIDLSTAPLELPRADDPLEIIEYFESEPPRNALAGKPPAIGSSAAIDADIRVDDRRPAQRGETSGANKISLAAPRPGLFRRFFRLIGWTLRSLFGIASLILLLAVIAAIPIVNFLALGYLLEVEGRVARSGRLRDAFPLVDLAPRLGSIVLGLALWVIPLRLLANAAADARLIDPGSRLDLGLHRLIVVLAVVVAVHLCLALARGGSLGAFFRPIKNFRWLKARWREGNYWSQAETALHDFVSGLKIKHHFWLGLRGYVGAMMWLFIPTVLFAATNKTEGVPILATLLGGVLLMLVFSWVPFLQAHFAAENRFGAMFELRTIRELYRNAPFSWLITMLITLTLALPMYLFKIALPPADAMWLVTVVFIVSIYPVKVITGWAYHRAVTRGAVEPASPDILLTQWRERDRISKPIDPGGSAADRGDAARSRLDAHRELRRFHRFVGRRIGEGFVDTTIRRLSRLVLVPLLALYVFLLFFTQFIGAHGKGVLFEHHAFLLPVPF